VGVVPDLFSDLGGALSGFAADWRALRLLDLVFPRRCVACGLGEELVCAACRAGLRRLDGTLCARCGAPTAWPVARCRECAGHRLSFASARAAVAYEGPARPLIAGWKERGLRPLAREFAGLVAEVVPRPPVDELSFVPGDPDRSLRRGHNAAEALARELAARWQLPVAALLKRGEPARPQRGLSREERRGNVRGSFAVVVPPPRHVALVDDVYTTGATVSAAAMELKRAGARSVHVVTFARTVRR
jgi:ComF family protein